MKLFISTIIGFFCEVFLFVFGNIDISLKYLIVAVVLDYITGLCKAIVTKKVNSSIGVKGVLKKIGYFFVVAIAVILGGLLNVGFTIRNITIYSLVINECISVLENCTQMGIKLPKIIASSLEIVNSKLLEKTDEICNKDTKKTKD